MHFAQVGPPRNVTVEQTDAGDEFIVSWLPPEYGLETLRVYVLKWYREPGHFLTGTAETRENYYKGNYVHLFLFPSLPPPPSSHGHFTKFITFIDFLLSSLTVRYLMEHELYSFQVFSLSTTDYLAGSNEFDIRIPAYRIRMRLVAIGITLVILLMLVFGAIYIYAKKRCFEPYPDNDEKLQRP